MKLSESCSPSPCMTLALDSLPLRIAFLANRLSDPSNAPASAVLLSMLWVFMNSETSAARFSTNDLRNPNVESSGFIISLMPFTFTPKLSDFFSLLVNALSLSLAALDALTIKRLRSAFLMPYFLGFLAMTLKKSTDARDIVVDENIFSAGDVTSPMRILPSFFSPILFRSFAICSAALRVDAQKFVPSLNTTG